VPWCDNKVPHSAGTDLGRGEQQNLNVGNICTCAPCQQKVCSAFLSADSANRKESEEAALESNAVACTILTMIQANGDWQGTAADLIMHLRKRYPTQTEGSDTFPRQPAAFGAELRRVAPLLRSRGVSVIHSRAGKDRRRVIELKLT
jgi:putative DNA primase/helicase